MQPEDLEKTSAETIQEPNYEGMNKSFDQIQTDDEVSDDRIEALCERMYERALSCVFTKQEREVTRKMTKNQLQSWKILVREGERYYATNAFHLLEGTPGTFPDAYVQCAVFKGTDRSNFINKKEVRGPIDQQVEDATRFVMQNIRLGSRIDSVYRKDFYELPLDSVREMIVNAVCHRSYVRRGCVEVAIYDDRLEVTSPGRIDTELSLDDLREGISKIRNVAIAAAFTYMRLIESWGTGVQRIFNESKRYHLKEPKMQEVGDSFRVTMYRRPFDTDQFGVIDPAKAEKEPSENDGQSQASGHAPTQLPTHTTQLPTQSPTHTTQFEKALG